MEIKGGLIRYNGIIIRGGIVIKSSTEDEYIDDVIILFNDSDEHITVVFNVLYDVAYFENNIKKIYHLDYLGKSPDKSNGYIIRDNFKIIKPPNRRHYLYSNDYIMINDIIELFNMFILEKSLE